MAFLLQLPQARRVGGTDIHHGVIGQGGQQLQGGGVIVGSQLQGGQARFAEVEAQHRRPLTRWGQLLTLEDATHRPGPLVVEPHAVEGGPLGRQAKQPRPGIAALGFPGHRAQLGEAEAEAVPQARGHTVLVEAGGQTHRIGEAATEESLLEPWITALELQGQPLQRVPHHGPVTAQGSFLEDPEADPTQLLGVGALIGAEQRLHETAVKPAGRS